MVHRVEDRSLLWGWLNEAPVWNATLIHRVLFRPYREVYVDDPAHPQAVLTVDPARRPGEWTGVALAGDPEAARSLLARVPSGPYFLFLGDATLETPWRTEVGGVEGWRPARLQRLDSDGFVDLQDHEVAPLREEHASLVARRWSPDWDGAWEYVASRIREGLSFAVYEDGEPVAWNLTHFESDRVGMMGFLHVEEPHRGRGYAKAVGSALARAILAREKVPVLHVFEDNVPSLHLTARLGFRSLGVQVWADGVRAGSA